MTGSTSQGPLDGLLQRGSAAGETRFMCSFILRLAVSALVLCSTALPLSALAEAPETTIDTTQEHEFDDSKLSRAASKRRRARIGVGFSAVGLSVGAILLGVGAALHGTENGSGDVSKQINATPVLITGAVLAAGGFAGLPPSALGLHRAKHEIRRLESKAPLTGRDADSPLLTRELHHLGGRGPQSPESLTAQPLKSLVGRLDSNRLNP